MSLTRVVPVWVKVAGLLLVVGFFCLQFFGEEEPVTNPASGQVVAPGPDLQHGLPGQAIDNTRAVATKLFSPVVEAEHAPVLVRPSDDKPYYQDESK